MNRKTKQIQADEVICPYCYWGSFTRRYRNKWTCDNCYRKFTVSKGEKGIKYKIRGIRKGNLFNANSKRRQM